MPAPSPGGNGVEADGPLDRPLRTGLAPGPLLWHRSAMRLRSLARLVLVSLALLVPRLAPADDLSVELIGKALLGQTRPGLVLYANKAVVQATATLRRADGATLRLQSGRIASGSRKELLFDAPAGTHRYEGKLAVEFVDGTSGEMPLAFEILVSEGVRVEVSKDAIDLEGGRLPFTFTGVADKCEYDVAYDGRPAQHGWMRFAGEPPGTELILPFTPGTEKNPVIRIQLTCHDREGFYSPTVEIYPWRIDIPHEDVIFETGRWEIRPEEAGKLAAARKEIQTVLRRYQTALRLDHQTIRLYVVGHTDTVGDAASNRALSLKRARAIAQHFRANGIQVPIFYAGMGEDAPAVPTADETDEPRNRRAEYVLSVDPPRGIKWERL